MHGYAGIPSSRNVSCSCFVCSVYFFRLVGCFSVDPTWPNHLQLPHQQTAKGGPLSPALKFIAVHDLSYGRGQVRVRVAGMVGLGGNCSKNMDETKGHMERYETNGHMSSFGFHIQRLSSHWKMG